MIIVLHESQLGKIESDTLNELTKHIEIDDTTLGYGLVIFNGKGDKLDRLTEEFNLCSITHLVKYGDIKIIKGMAILII